MNDKKRPLIIGITGGTGSGKSTVCKAIIDNIPEENIATLEQDAYYKDQSHLTFEERLKTNYDHPLSFDNKLLIKHIEELCEGKTIEKPIYDYELHTRKQNETVTISPKDIIIVEGIMILEDEELRDKLDIKIYVDTEDDIRILRRIQRDIKERGRTVDSVIEQYLSTVKPAHDQFIEPYKKYADIIMPEGGQPPCCATAARCTLTALPVTGVTWAPSTACGKPTWKCWTPKTPASISSTRSGKSTAATRSCLRRRSAPALWCRIRWSLRAARSTAASSTLC